MLHLTALILKSDERSVICGLGEIGAVHLTQSMLPKRWPGLTSRDRHTEIAQCNRLLERVRTLQESLRIPSPTRVPRAERRMDDADHVLGVMEERAANISARRREIEASLGEIESLREKLADYQGFGLSLDGNETYFHFMIGSIPSQNCNTLETSARRIFIPLGRTNGRRRVIVMAARHDRDSMDQMLRSVGFQAETLPRIEGETIDALWRRNERSRAENESALARIEAEHRELSDDAARQLGEIDGELHLKHLLFEAEEYMPGTESTVLIEGWIPASQADALRRRLNETTSGRCVMTTAHPTESEADEIPVLLKPSSLLGPFQKLVTAYGFPKYHEIEPTFFLAISYVAMFGMMFGDAGQGAVLTALGACLFSFSRGAPTRDAGLLLIAGGISSMGFGIVYGSYFGLPGFKSLALWRDPLEGDPLVFLRAAIGAGSIVLTLGFLLNIVNRIRRRDILGGVLDKFGLAGLLFYWGALILLIQYEAIQASGHMGAAAAIFFGIPIAGWALQGPLRCLVQRGSLSELTTESLAGVVEAVIGYLANTVSFVRLAAYAMSHAALMTAVLSLAGMFGDGLMSVSIIVLGNLVIIALEGLIASVQALRLEYYEFFGKFFAGEGRPYKPFSFSAHDSLQEVHA